MSKISVLVSTWASLCWALTSLAWATAVSTNISMNNLMSTTGTSTEESGPSFIDMSIMKIKVQTKTPTSFRVEWNVPRSKETTCRLVNRRISLLSKETEKLTIIHIDLLPRDAKITNFRGLNPDTLYEVVLECLRQDKQNFRIRKIVRTLAKDGSVTLKSKSERKVDVTTDAWEPRIQRVKQSTKRPSSNGTDGGTLVFGNSSSAGNETNGNSLSKHQRSPSDENTKRLIWLIPTIAGSVAGLMIIVSATVACSRAMVKTRNHGKFTVSHRESGKKLITKSKPDEVAQGQDSELKQCPDQKALPREMSEIKSPNTLQIRQHSHLTVDSRVAMSGISWGSEFDVLDKPDSIYTNETMGTQNSYPAIPEPSTQVPAPAFRQNSLPGPTSPVAGRPWQPFSPTRAGTMPRSDDPPMYADTMMMNFDTVVPSSRNTRQEVGIYTNLQVEESIYVNTGSEAEERPPMIPPRPR